MPKYTVWKFPLEYSEEIIELQLPEQARIIHTDHNNGKPCLWALVKPNNPLETRKFRILGTGQECTLKDSAQLIYIGTLKGLGGGLFVHIFEQTDWFHKLPTDII